jgi:hypothetical protein
MLRKFTVVATLAGAALALAIPAAAAGPGGATQPVRPQYVAEYPSLRMAEKACRDGIAWGLWKRCVYSGAPNNTVALFVVR